MEKVTEHYWCNYLDYYMEVDYKTEWGDHILVRVMQDGDNPHFPNKSLMRQEAYEKAYDKYIALLEERGKLIRV